MYNAFNQRDIGSLRRRLRQVCSLSLSVEKMRRRHRTIHNFLFGEPAAQLTVEIGCKFDLTTVSDNFHFNSTVNMVRPFTWLPKNMKRPFTPERRDDVAAGPAISPCIGSLGPVCLSLRKSETETTCKGRPAAKNSVEFAADRFIFSSQVLSEWVKMKNWKTLNFFQWWLSFCEHLVKNLHSQARCTIQRLPTSISFLVFAIFA